MKILKDILHELQEIKKALLSIKEQQEHKNKKTDIMKQGINPW